MNGGDHNQADWDRAQTETFLSERFGVKVVIDDNAPGWGIWGDFGAAFAPNDCPACGGNLAADALDDQILCTDCGWRG